VVAYDQQQERNRLANRVREQLWRYYPQALAVSDDLAADWFLELWAAAPMPEKAARIRGSTLERILKAHRTRRITAAEMLRILQQPALTVAPGTAEAASAHIRAVAERLKLVNRQIHEAHRQLDGLCARLAQETPWRGRSFRRPARIAGSSRRAARALAPAAFPHSCWMATRAQ
jgi:hypothetical protein